MLTTRLIFAATYSKANQKLLNATSNKKITDVDLIDEALEQGADLNIRDIRVKSEVSTIGYDYTPLMWACYHGKLAQVKELILRGADVNLETRYANTAFHIAAREGKTEVVEYLGDLFPHLLSKPGQYDQLPHEIAIKNGPYRKVVKTFDENFYDPYFGTIKCGISFEIALLIAFEINDPIALKNLSMINRTWRQLTQDAFFHKHYENSLKSLLPQTLQTRSWAEIYTYYFPFSPVPKTDLVTNFVERLHTAYLVGERISLLEDKETSVQILQTVILLGFILAHQSGFPDSKRYRDIPNSEIESALIDKLTSAKEGGTTIQVFRELNQASRKEAEDGNQVSNNHRYKSINRRPVFEMQLNNQGALDLLKKKESALFLNVKGLRAVNNWRLTKELKSFVHDEVPHEIESPSLRKFT